MVADLTLEELAMLDYARALIDREYETLWASGRVRDAELAAVYRGVVVRLLERAHDA